MRPRVFMWVQTRLGLGHLARALSVCGALAKDGFDVTLAHGGPPVTALSAPLGVKMIQLPVAHAPDLERSEIRDADDRPVDGAWRARRIEALRGAIQGCQPHVVLTETFPLGRWLFSFELIPVLDWMHGLPNRPLVAASVRDILTRPSKPGKIDAMIALARTHYDLILCHSDEDIIRLPDSFPETHEVAGKTRYTGYVVEIAPSPAEARSGVIVAAGGGAVGGRLFEAATGAKRLWSRDTGPWTLVAGPRFDPAALAQLRAGAQDGMAIEGAVTGLAARYARAALVVGQAGYNTVCEALAQGARLTVVPYATAKETEQTIRAKRFADLGLLTSVKEDELSAPALAAAMERALDAPPPARSLRVGGGHQTARILRQVLAERTA